MPAPDQIDRPLLRMSGIAKSYPGVAALRDVDFELRAGEAHALSGENGAGKSTLMGVLSGNVQPDAGEIRLDGQRIALGSPQDAAAHGIAIVHQELSLFPSLTVAENIFAGRLPRRFGLFDRKAVNRQVLALRDILEVEVDPRALVSDLPVGQQQIVEILKALSERPRILILDEPTSSLSEVEAETLFETVRRLKSRGIAIVYISHRLREIMALCERVTVLRDGRLVGVRDTGDLTAAEISRLMIGRDPPEVTRKAAPAASSATLELRGFTRGKAFRNVSFTARSGEVIGIAGLIGAGRTELARAVIGLDRRDAGETLIDGVAVAIRSPADAVAAGLAYLPEDRRTDGLFLPMSVAANVVASDLSGSARFGVVSPRLVSRRARDAMAALAIKAWGPAQIVRQLSGGNQQKISLAMRLQRAPRLLIADEPTRGVDVGAKAEIHNLLRSLSAGGAVVIVISSELPEILTVSDRILVMHAGELVGDMPRAEATEELIMACATGLARTAADVNGKSLERPS